MKRAQKEAHRLQINVEKDPELKQLLKKIKKEKKRQKLDWRKLFWYQQWKIWKSYEVKLIIIIKFIEYISNVSRRRAS